MEPLDHVLYFYLQSLTVKVVRIESTNNEILMRDSHNQHVLQTILLLDDIERLDCCVILP